MTETDYAFAEYRKRNDKTNENLHKQIDDLTCEIKQLKKDKDDLILEKERQDKNIALLQEALKNISNRPPPNQIHNTINTNNNNNTITQNNTILVQPLDLSKENIRRILDEHFDPRKYTTVAHMAYFFTKHFATAKETGYSLAVVCDQSRSIVKYLNPDGTITRDPKASNILDRIARPIVLRCAKCSNEDCLDGEIDTRYCKHEVYHAGYIDEKKFIDALKPTLNDNEKANCVRQLK